MSAADTLPAEGAARGHASRGALFSWALYDWANSAFHTVILTFVFAAYFTRAVAPNETVGTQVWGNTIGIGGFLVALLGPVLGAATDQTGRRKPWIIFFSFLCIVPTGLLWFVYPNSTWMWPGALLAGLSAFAIEVAIIFYNAMLPGLAGRDRIGRWSGWGWGLGYVGGLACLVVVLVFFVEERTRIAALNTDTSQHLRASFLLVAVWYAVFAIPFFLFTPDTPSTGKTLRQGIRDGLGQLGESFRSVRQYAHIVRFLIARIFYVDALATLFSFGGVYAAGTFNMDERKILLFGIALNVTAGLGAFAFSWIDDLIGSKRTIILSLLGLIIPGTAMLIVTSETWFWVAGIILGIFVGPAQAASRSYMGRLAPPELENQMFGFYTFSGKATAFVGPILVAFLTGLSGSQRIGMSSIIVFFVIGLVLMTTLPRAVPYEGAADES